MAPPILDRRSLDHWSSIPRRKLSAAIATRILLSTVSSLQEQISAIVRFYSRSVSIVRLRAVGWIFAQHHATVHSFLSR